MRNFVQPGNTITVPAIADTVGGAAVVIGSIFAVAAGDAKTGEPLDLATVGVFDLPKVAADDVAVGDPLYWDVENSLVTIDDAEGANSKIGVAVAPAAATTATARVRLNGTF
jgi:predicted RecA/RadA family phage recombinase